MLLTDKTVSECFNVNANRAYTLVLRDTVAPGSLQQMYDCNLVPLTNIYILNKNTKFCDCREGLYHVHTILLHRECPLP